MKNKRIFISGGAGVIGTALVNLLIQKEADLFVGDLKTCPKEWLGKLKYRQGDLNSLSLEEISDFNPQVFFHLAATFERSEESYPFFGENFHHNVALSHHLMSLFKQIDSLETVIFASSYLIYDPKLYLSNEETDCQPLQEDSPVNPRNTCGGAKYFHEQELQFLSHFLPKTRFISARIFRVYGIGSRDVISRWVRSALRQDKIHVYRPEGKFDYIFSGDVAEALFRLVSTKQNGIVNIGSGKARSIHEVLALLKTYFPSLEIETSPSDLPYENSQANIDRLKDWTGWEPAHTLESALPKLIEYEKRPLATSKVVKGVLISSVSAKAPLVDALRKATEKIGQFQEIHGSDLNQACIGSYLVDAFWPVPPLNELNPDDVASYCEQHQIGAIIPTRDGELEFFAEHAIKWQKKGIATMVSKLDSVRKCLDKWQFAKFMHDEHFPVIPTYEDAALLDAPFFVVKERKGAGSKNMGIKLTREEAMRHAKELKEPLFQPYIEGKEWSIDMYRTRDGKIKGSVARLRDLVVQGESQVTTTSSHPSLERLCHEMAERLDLYGHVIFQVIEDTQGHFHVIECNPRFGGASTASLAVGLDSFYWFLLESLGIHLQDYPFNRKSEEVRQVRYLTDRIIPCPLYLI